MNVMRICVCIGALHSGSVLELWAHNDLTCSLTDTCMFSFDVSFDKTAFELILFIPVCVLKFKLVYKSTPRYLAEDTLLRAFQELLADFADPNR